MMIFAKQKSDTLGALASTLCLIHCVATPFIFIAQSCSLAYDSTTPTWWKMMEYFFLIISFLAIYRATETTSSNWMKFALWISWLMLLIVIVNEKLGWLPLPETIVYIPALTLIGLHLYNRKYCRCTEKTCCVDERK